MTDLRKETERLLALADSATPGPFVAMEKPAASFADHGWRRVASMSENGIGVYTRSAKWTNRGWSFATEEDAKFLAAAHDMAAHIRALQAEIDALRTLALDAYRAWDTDKDMRVGKLLTAMLNHDFRASYRPDLAAMSRERGG